MEEVFEEPRPEDGDSALGEAPLRPPHRLVVEECGIVVNGSLAIWAVRLLLLLVELELVGNGVL